MGIRVKVIMLVSLGSIICLFFLLMNGFSAESIITSKGDDYSYGVICDAGSTGTRMFLYRWTTKSDHELINITIANDASGNPVVKKVSPGLSTFGKKPTEAAEYIRPLMELAEKNIPAEKILYTPVFIFATAGMRLIPKQEQEEVLRDLRTKLPHMTKMQVVKEHIRVIEGSWEGIYSWIAVNYALVKFFLKELHYYMNLGRFNGTERQNTVGMIDMGGASAQIAFELPVGNDFMSSRVTNINLGCREENSPFKYKLFVTTFLGYGVNEGLRKYEQKISDGMKNESVIDDVCMPKELSKTVARDDGSKFLRKGVGNWTQCVEKISAIIDPVEKEGVCKIPSTRCYFGSVSAPKLSLSEMEFYGFSEYWYSTQDVLGLGGNYDFEKLKNKAQEFCEMKWDAIESSKANRFPDADDDRLRTQCFKSAWISAVLHNGFSFDKMRNRFQSAQKIAGQEVQWALGAMIYNMRFFPLQSDDKNVIVSTVPASSMSMVPLLLGLGFIAFIVVVWYLTIKPKTPTFIMNPLYRLESGYNRFK